MSATQKLINEIIEKLGEEGPIVVTDIDILAGYFNQVLDSAREEFRARNHQVYGGEQLHESL